MQVAINTGVDRGEFVVLDPDVLLRADGGVLRREVSALARASTAVAPRAIMFTSPSAMVRPVLVNGAAGVLFTAEGHLVSVMGLIVCGGRIVEMPWSTPNAGVHLTLAPWADHYTIQ